MRLLYVMYMPYMLSRYQAQNTANILRQDMDTTE